MRSWARRAWGVAAAECSITWSPVWDQAIAATALASFGEKTTDTKVPSASSTEKDSLKYWKSKSANRQWSYLQSRHLGAT